MSKQAKCGFDQTNTVSIKFCKMTRIWQHGLVHIILVVLDERKLSYKKKFWQQSSLGEPDLTRLAVTAARNQLADHARNVGFQAGETGPRTLHEVLPQSQRAAASAEYRLHCSHCIAADSLLRLPSTPRT